MKSETVIASAPAKVILFGEHFVVYGKPAIAVAIDRRVYVKVGIREDRKLYIRSLNLEISGYFRNEKFVLESGKESAEEKFEPIRVVTEKLLEASNKDVGVTIEIDSQIPVAAGLGSSASVATATATALNHLLNAELSREEIFKVTFEAEKLIHGTPSGIDPAIATYGGAIIYRKDEGFQPINIEFSVPLIVGDTGLERSTGSLVAHVKQIRNAYPEIVNSIFEAGEKIVEKAVQALKEGDLEVLGRLMLINHGLLFAIGVSHEKLDKLVHAALRAGAYGAKLTGAGGGGCMIAIAPSKLVDQVISSIEQAGGTAFSAKINVEGARIEN